MTQSGYSPYLQMSMVPAGAILDHIIQKQKLAKRDVAAQAGMIPQRITDLIHGARRFTPQCSMSIEKVLGIDIAGFFYLAQTNHDIYLAQNEASFKPSPDLGILTKTTFWDVDLAQIDWQKCQDWAIRRVLEYGTSEEIRELNRFYGHEALMKVYGNADGFRLYDQVKINFKKAGL